eukprot:1176600-Prorocentrum_minimum.AAC.2
MTSCTTRESWIALANNRHETRGGASHVRGERIYLHGGPVTRGEREYPHLLSDDVHSECARRAVTERHSLFQRPQLFRCGGSAPKAAACIVLLLVLRRFAHA